MNIGELKHRIRFEQNQKISAGQGGFDSNWRHARRELQELSGIEQNWTEGTPDMIRKLESKIRGLNAKLPRGATITKKKALA